MTPSVPLGHLLVLSYPVLTADGQTQMPQTEKSLVTKGSNSPLIKVWTTPLVNPPTQQRCQGKENQEWVVKGDQEYPVAIPRPDVVVGCGASFAH